MLRLKRPMWFMEGEGGEITEGDGDSNGGNLDGSDTGGDVTSTWPESWREDYAGEDEKKLSRVAKYASPPAALDAMIAAQNKISSGEFKSTAPFPNEGTDEDKSAWRTNNGIPEAPDKYDLSFDDGLVIGEEDKGYIDDFLKSAHTSNMPPEQAKAAVHWYYDNLEKQAEERAEQDTTSQQATEDSLRAEWGNDYRQNINRIHGFLDQAGEDVKDQIMGARLDDGSVASPASIPLVVP